LQSVVGEVKTLEMRREDVVARIQFIRTRAGKQMVDQINGISRLAGMPVVVPETCFAEPQKSAVSESDGGCLKLPDSVRLAVMGTGTCGLDGRMKDVVISAVTIAMKETKREDR
jgi:hypothetical protein